MALLLIGTPMPSRLELDRKTRTPILDRLWRPLPLGVAVFAGFLVACEPSRHAVANEKDPLAALKVPIESEVFDLAFWVREQSTRTALWRRAFVYCRFHPELPNCRTVRMASWWGSPPSQASVKATPTAEAPPTHEPPPTRSPEGRQP
jgi:hypothetical protein